VTDKTATTKTGGGTPRGGPPAGPEPAATVPAPGAAQEPRAPAGLTPVAARLVAAARALLARGGFRALTVEAVAAEAGAYRDAVRYHFGSKAALVAAVVDSLAHDQSLAAAEQTRDLPAGPARVRALVAGDRRLLDDRDAFRDFFALFPHVVQDPELRARVAELYDWYRDLYAAGMAGGTGSGDDVRRRDVASLMVAMTDGLAVQELLEPDPGRMDRLFRLWEEFLDRETGS
jgi:AcrR family transcriptional regulator